VRESDVDGRRAYDRRLLLVELAILTPVGFATKLYHGPLGWWVNRHLGGVVYVVFFTLLAGVLVPRARAARLAIVVLAVTCALELTQLSAHPALVAIRRHFLGRALIGTTMDPWDFPHYAAGAFLGWLLLRKAAAGGRAS
jgi:hypothetical protein